MFTCLFIYLFIYLLFILYYYYYYYYLFIYLFIIIIIIFRGGGGGGDISSPKSSFLFWTYPGGPDIMTGVILLASFTLFPPTGLTAIEAGLPAATPVDTDCWLGNFEIAVFWLGDFEIPAFWLADVWIDTAGVGEGEDLEALGAAGLGAVVGTGWET